MKKSLKKSEIIENLHRVIPLVGHVSVEIPLFSIIQLEEFKVRYVMVIKYSDIFQVVVIELTYGWIEYTFGTVSHDLKPQVYSEYINAISC